MKKIMFNDKYSLTQAVLEGRKTMTRRIIPIKLIQKYGHNKFNDRTYELIRHCTAYQPGEEVAVAQSYYTIKESHKDDIPVWANIVANTCDGEPGCYNKMFVKADLMPHRIRITNVKVERLQAISDEDCLKEGVQMFDTPIGKVYVAGGVYVGDDARLKIAKGMVNFSKPFNTPKEAFKILIDKVSGKGTFESNPYVFAYSFKLLD